MDPTYFLNLLSPRRSTMVRIMLKNGDMSALDHLMRNEAAEVQNAYNVWKAATLPAIPLNDEENYYEVIDESSQSTVEGKKQIENSVPCNGIQSTSKETLLDETYMTADVNAPTSHTIDPLIELTKNAYSSLTLTNEPQVDTVSFTNISPELLAKLDPETTIVLLSETGTGKSTFINVLINVLKYNTIDAAIKEGVEILIRAIFTQVNENAEILQIDCTPTIQQENCPDCFENETNSPGASSTQLPQSYIINVGPPGEEKIIRIIDTPGIGDTRGIEQEQKNIRNILNLLAEYSKINAICILLKSNEARLNTMFNYSLSELLSHLHVSAAKNILFCFTGVRGTQYKIGETLIILNTFLKSLRERRNIDIALQGSTFCFENDCFRFLCALHKGVNFSQKEIDSFQESWNFTSNEVMRLLHRVSDLKPHDVTDTLSINNTRSIVLAIARPLAELSRIEKTNTQLIDEKIKEVETLIRHEESLKGRLFVQQAKLAAVTLEYPITVCTSKSCVEYRSLSNEKDAPMETIYKTECHPRCFLDGVQTSIVPNVALQQCYAFQSNIDECRVCKCSWNMHMHISYRLQTVLEETVDVTVERNINNYKEQVRQAELFLDELRGKRAQVELESKFIAQSCIQFATFLKSYSIIPYNDTYKDYLDHLITEEKNKLCFGGNDQMLKYLEKVQQEYEQKIALLQNIPTTASPMSTLKIKQLVEELKSLPNSGKLLRDVQNLELLSVKQQKDPRYLIKKKAF